ncbi:molybdopterin molybdotransferase MoeA [Pontixanthobacter aestiaquae]|uniref:Molybdopterin molybdenumtransferase n=1 Tax=Pontixanthobacter aestiaquae TaxID=1509367 RepID=A0A844Z770_9SPHN|nr:molybdopterin molybdotransferase MoeA [Pontixanthobacter aestiaquae]MDN3645341.1 molybdopterin molybdotransferase MoeA [Pontixanthobacter aestiaquae]MXO83658.1 molybdopterin molybdenumtransferase MoeA [Pontixanthobacter aestiaquae]
MKPPIPLHEAQARLLDLVQPTATETVSCEDALGRYLAAPLIAKRTQPAADLSAMDGFAVSGEGSWRVIGESRCGVPFGGSVSAGEATRISTGAHVPKGAEAIVLVEDAKLASGNQLTATEEPISGRHIRRAGSDFETGAHLLETGTRITAARLALTRMAGHSSLTVHTAPEVAILECGDELSTMPHMCNIDQIPATNGAMLSAMTLTEKVVVQTSPPIPDNLDALAATIETYSGTNLLIISGGASVGDHDLVRPALHRLGAKIDFWRVAMKPGKPLMVATRGKQIILGLPGNPVSSYVTGFLFMLPALRRLLGAKECIPNPISLPCYEDLPAGGPRRTFMRATFGEGQVTPIAQQGSGALGALAQADVLIERPEHCGVTKSGAHVPVYILPTSGVA